MPLDHFDPPAFLTDMLPAQQREWSAAVSGWMDELIEFLIQDLGESPFYNATKTDPSGATATQAIVWNGFPKVLRLRYSRAEALSKAEELEPIAGYYKNSDGQLYQRRQDEYLEWRTVTDTVSGKITSIIFTVEPPEYWQALKGDTIPGYSDGKSYSFTANPDKLLALYHQYVDASVKIEDLLFPDDWCENVNGDEVVIYRKGEYNPFNRWNTTDGIMHLTHLNNSLRAEIKLAADATIRYKDAQNRSVMRPDELCCCSGFGAPNRCSDPTIGGSVNQLARLGALLTLANPVGLYIDSFDMAGITDPQGRPITADYWTVQRGDVARGLISRAVFAVPPEKNFAVSDLTIGGEPITCGGQLAEHITLKLFGMAGSFGQVNVERVMCICHCCIDQADKNTLRMINFETGCGSNSQDAFVHGQGGDYYTLDLAAARPAMAPGQRLASMPQARRPHLSRVPPVSNLTAASTPPPPADAPSGTGKKPPAKAG